MTLVELLVALVLLSFLALMLTGSLRFSIRAWERTDVHLADAARIRLTQNVIRRYLSAARPNAVQRRSRRSRTAANTGINASNPEPAFSGGPNQIEFLAPLPAHLGRGGLYRMILDVSANDDGKSQLRLRWRPDKTGLETDTEENWRETILLPTIANLTFSYFGAPDKNTAADWSGSWESAKEIPEVVKLSVAFPNDDRRLWPELAVRLMLASR